MAFDANSLGAAIAQGLRGKSRTPSYRIRVPIGSDIDTSLRGTFGTKGAKDYSFANQNMRNTYRYSGAGRYSRGVGGIRRRGLRSSGLRMYPRRTRRYGGRGGYWMQKLFGAKPGGFWDSAGDFVGNAASKATFGMSDLVDRGAQGIHRQLTGKGMYMGNGAYVQSNNIVDQGSAVSGFNNIPDGNSVTISHREYIGDVYGPPSGNFTNVVYNINPGLERTFPWLSQIACNYDEYTLGQLMFTYRPTVTEFAAASGQQGQVIMATQYNANDAPFTDKRVMMQYDGAMSSKVSCEQIQGVECNPAKLSGDQGKYIRNRPVLSDQDKNTYDHGQFNIAIADIPVPTYANQSLGELWVSYTVELRKPKFYSNKGLSITKDIYCTNQVKFPAIQTANRPFGEVNSDRRMLGQQNTLESQMVLNSGANLTVPLGTPQFSVDGAGQEQLALSTGTEIFGYKLVLPAYWSGNLEILQTLVLRGTGAIIPNPYLFYCEGNITPIRDIVTGEGTGPPNNAWTFGMTATGQQQATFPTTSLGVSVMNLVHLRVQEASGGIDNAIYVVISPSYPLGPLQVWSGQLQLTEYNVGLNYKPDGGNDAIILTDINGNVVTPF